MNAHISQHIAVRRRPLNNCSAHLTYTGSWQTRMLGRRSASFFSQRGSVTPSAVTLALAFVAIIGIALLGFFYLQQVFGTASQGSDVQALETQISELKEKQRQLELSGAELRSLNVIEQRAKRLNLVTARAVAYLPANEGRVAMNTSR